MLELINCLYPNNTPLTAQYYGCHCQRCRKAKSEAQRRYRSKHYEKYKRTTKNYCVKIKTEVFSAYGGLMCNCCGETEFQFLSLDHVFNDGYIKRQELKTRCAGASVYLDLRRNNYPDKHRYQVLCMNCNYGKKLNGGVCPHKTKIKVEAF